MDKNHAGLSAVHLCLYFAFTLMTGLGIGPSIRTPEKQYTNNAFETEAQLESARNSLNIRASAINALRMMFWRKRQRDEGVPPPTHPYETVALVVGGVIVFVLLVIVIWYAARPQVYHPHVPQTESR